jgi:hypothetical protein
MSSSSISVSPIPTPSATPNDCIDSYSMAASLGECQAICGTNYWRNRPNPCVRVKFDAGVCGIRVKCLGCIYRYVPKPDLYPVPYGIQWCFNMCSWEGLALGHCSNFRADGTSGCELWRQAGCNQNQTSCS